MERLQSCKNSTSRNKPYVLGQGLQPQFRMSIWGPVPQLLMHSLCRCFTASNPQVCEHGLHLAQSEYPISAGKEEAFLTELVMKNQATLLRKWNSYRGRDLTRKLISLNKDRTFHHFLTISFLKVTNATPWQIFCFLLLLLLRNLYMLFLSLFSYNACHSAETLSSSSCISIKKTRSNFPIFKKLKTQRNSNNLKSYNFPK